jgi:hypothetical protein
LGRDKSARIAGINMICTLCEIRGMIANLAIENQDHNKTLSEIDELIGKYGLLARVDIDKLLKVLYET